MPAQELPRTTAVSHRHQPRIRTRHRPHRARRAQLGDTFTPVSAGATDPVAAGQLLGKHRSRTLILNAGAGP